MINSFVATASYAISAQSPAQVTLTYPTNGASIDPVGVHLNWTASTGATSYDVYFGSTNPPPFFSNAGGGTGIAFSSLNAAQTYYWNVVAKNGAGSAPASATWSFTTVSIPPSQVTLASPANAAGNLSSPVTLIWNPSGGAPLASYDVYLGPSNPPALFSSGVSGNTLSTGTLSASQTYYWNVVARNIAGSAAASATWSFSTSASTGGGWYGGSWQYRKAITVNANQVTGTQINFPMLVSLASDPDLKADALTNGYDIVFTDASGTSPLPYERELYNSSTGQLIAWVNVPSLSNGAVIYMYFGNSSETTDQQNRTGAWNGDYVMVQHFGNGTLSANDSTSNGLNGTITGATATSGIIGGAGSYNGTTGTYIDYGTGNAIDTAISTLSGGWTISSWFYANGGADQGSLFGNGNNIDSARGIVIDSGLGVGVSLMDAKELVVCSSGATLITGWHSVVWTYNNGANTEYLDGASICTLTFSFYGSGYSGHNYTSVPVSATSYGEPFNGAIDETRVSNISLPAGWIATEYNNQSSPGSFFTKGSLQ
jgi:hypothetical protein